MYKFRGRVGSASRKGQLERLSHAELKRLAARAKKEYDKWHGLGRGQSARPQPSGWLWRVGRQHRAQAQVFREALESFEARLTTLDASSAHSAKKLKPKTKKDRTAEHRTVRAAVRKGMTAVEDLLNVERHKKKKAKKHAASAAGQADRRRGPAGKTSRQDATGG